MTIAAISSPATTPPSDAVADLLEQQRAGAAAAGDLGLDVGDRDGREQQRHADPVVEPALDVEPLADPLRHARLGDDRLPQRGVGRRQHDRQDHGLLDASARRRSRPPPRRPSAIVSGSPMPSSRTGTSTVAAQLHRDRCARRRRTAPAPASPRPASRTVALVLERSIPSSTFGPDQQPEGDEHHRRRDRRPRQPPRDRGDAEQRERHERERPLHLSASCRLGGTCRLDSSALPSRPRGPSGARRSAGRRPSRRLKPPSRLATFSNPASSG